MSNHAIRKLRPEAADPTLSLLFDDHVGDDVTVETWSSAPAVPWPSFLAPGDRVPPANIVQEAFAHKLEHARETALKEAAARRFKADLDAIAAKREQEIAERKTVVAAH